MPEITDNAGMGGNFKPEQAAGLELKIHQKLN